MPLYSKIETSTSNKYLQEVVNILKEPVCLLGGWAVYFTVNENFSEAQGRNYLGSKDIDIGFYLDEDIGTNALKQSTLGKSIESLKDRGFRGQGSRFYLDIDRETKEELDPESAKGVATHNIIKIYVDLIVDNIHPDFREIFGFQPIDEPLLKHVFTDDKHHRELKEFGKKLLLPSPEILIATKAKSIPGRTRDEKKIKDVCDLYALAWYSNKKFRVLKNESSPFIEDAQKVLDELNSEALYEKAGTALEIEADTVKSTLTDFLSSTN